MPVLTAEEYVQMAGLAAATPLGTYQVLCDSAGKALEDYLGRQLDKATRTEFYSANGTKAIALRCRPVWSVTEVRYDPRAWYGSPVGSFDSTTIMTQGVDYVLDMSTPTWSESGLLVRITGLWDEFLRERQAFRLTRDMTPSWGDIKVTYVGGFDPVPGPLKLACAQLVTRLRQMIAQGAPLHAEHLGDWGYRLADTFLRGPAELGTTKQLLAKYREIPW